MIYGKSVSGTGSEVCFDFRVKMNTKSYIFAIIGAIITIVLNIILIPVFGFMACGYAFFVASLVMTVSSYFVGQKYFPVKYDLKRMGIYLLTSVVLYLIEVVVVIGDKFLKIGFNTIRAIRSIST